MGMFSPLSLLAMAIIFCLVLLLVPVIKAVTSRKPDLALQIKLLEDELQASHQKYLESQEKIQKLISEKAALHQEGLRLHEELQQQHLELTEEFRTSTFEQLQTLLTNYPSIQQMVSVKPELPAKNLLSLFAPLDNLLSKWGYEQIGKPWEQVAYNSQLHQPDTSDITEGELVYIRFIGYQHQGKILCPAKVSRTLPGKGK
jgi:molecular chaperone GrpE (heat shock protein)